MADLERTLTELRVEWPPTPDIAGAVRRRIEQEGEAERRPHRDRLSGARRWALRPALAYGAALLLVALATTMAVSEPARSAILEFFGLKSARIERREPNAPPASAGGRAPLGADLGLGRRVTLAQARDSGGFEAAGPKELGTPGAIYVDDQLGVSFVYPPGPGLPESEQTGAGLLVTEVLGQVTPYIGKAAGAGTDVRRLRIGADQAYFLSGEAHGFAYEAHTGDVRFEDQRLAGNTLLVEHGDLLLRIEGEISRARAVALARSITATLDS